jgi:GT2 family glycosyltransferase
MEPVNLIQPPVSVVMSVYNGNPYLREAVDSVLAQTFSDFEFIIIDDGSTDETAAILASYDDPRIQVHHQSNRGQAAARNWGFALARGELLAGMDADDRSHPERLQKQVEFLNRHPGIGLVGTARRDMDQTGALLRLLHYPTENSRLQADLLLYNCFCGASVLLRRVCIERVGIYRPEMVGNEDYDLWLRVSEHFQIANLDDPLYDYRNHAQSFSTKLGEAVEARDVIAVKQALQRRESLWLTHEPAAALVLARGYIRVACAESRLHHFEAAQESLRKALTLSEEMDRLDSFLEPIFAFIHRRIDWGWMNWRDAMNLMHHIFNYLPATAHELRLAQPNAVKRLQRYMTLIAP